VIIGKVITNEMQQKKAEQEKPTEVIEAKTMDPKVKENLSFLMSEFEENYNGLTTQANFASMTLAEEKALHSNILLGILGELMRIRKAVEEE